MAFVHKQRHRTPPPDDVRCHGLYAGRFRCSYRKKEGSTLCGTHQRMERLKAKELENRSKKKPPGAPAVSANDLWTMLLSTFRYSVRRSSYMPSECVEMYKKYSKHLSDIQRDKIVSEVAQELERAEALGQTVGMQCDHEMWSAFVAAHRALPLPAP